MLAHHRHCGSETEAHLIFGADIPSFDDLVRVRPVVLLMINSRPGNHSRGILWGRLGKGLLLGICGVVHRFGDACTWHWSLRVFIRVFIELADSFIDGISPL